MKAQLFVACLALLAVGCGSKEGAGGSTTTAAAPKKDVLAVKGPGGTVRIGDDLAKAKTAFPAPAGAQVFDTSMSFAILKTNGWSWADEKSKTGFEAATRDDKIVAMSVTELADTSGNAEKDEVAAIGEPIRKAESDAAAMLVWEDGANARFLLSFRKPNMLFGKGAITLIGAKEDLKLLNYRADDPDTFVKQLDAASNIGQQK